MSLRRERLVDALLRRGVLAGDGRSRRSGGVCTAADIGRDSHYQATRSTVKPVPM
jgi:hypothetical protein